MLNVEPILDGNEPVGFKINGYRLRRMKYDKEGNRMSFIGAGYILKYDQNDTHSDWRIWNKINKTPYRNFFVPVLVHGKIKVRRYVDREWIVQPYLKNLRMTHPKWAEDIVGMLFGRYGLNDLHDQNWGMCNRKIAIFDYGFL